MRSAPKHGLYLVEIRLTKACNLACRHCSVSAGDGGEDELTTGEIKDLLNSLKEMDVRYVTFTGGEPLLRTDLHEIIEYAEGLGLSTAMDTNGILLSSEMVDALKKAGLRHVQVSIDGVEETHDSIRGKGSFEKAVTGVKNSVAAGIRTTINFTVSGHNMNEVEDVVRIGEELRVDLVSMERFIPTGRGQAMEGADLSSGEFKDVLEGFFSLGERYSIGLNTTDPLRAVVLGDDPNRCLDRICGGCTAGIAGLTVSFGGVVLTCPKVPVSVGNIKDRSIEEIWLENQALTPLRTRQFKGRCQTCPMINLCGGCRAAALARSGDWLEEDPQCWM